MKIRTDFVSNSSSSSFIIAGDKTSFFAKYNLSKQDFVDAIEDLSGVKIDKDKYFCKIYDKSIPEDLNVINSEWSDYLKEWTTPFLKKVYDKDGNEDIEFFSALSRFDEETGVYLKPIYYSAGWHNKQWGYFYEHIKEIYDFLPYSWDPSVKTYYKYDRENDKNDETEIDSHIYQVLLDAYRHYGIMNHHEALNCGFSRTIIHFGDNDVYSLKGMNEAGKHEELYEGDSEWDKRHNEEVKNSTWETESQSLPRFCEVMVRWFKEHKKIPDTATWHDMLESIVGYCMHEG
jgi:hypothetical protein